MNKLKAIYDVLKIMKSKEMVTGSLTAKVEKDQVKMFGLESEFEKNLVTGKTKSKVNLEMDYEGRPSGGETGEFRFEHCHMMRGGHDGFHHHHGFHRWCGLRPMFSHWAFGISLVQALQLEPGEDKKVVFTLNTKDLPEDVKELFQQRIEHAAFRHHHGGRLMNVFQSSTVPDLIAMVLVNEQLEVEKIQIHAANEDGLMINGELSLRW